MLLQVIKMTKKIKAMLAAAALCVFGSAACFSGYAFENNLQYSGEDVGGDAGTVAVDPAPVTTDPVTPGYTEPVDPGYVDPITPGYTEPVVSNYDPGYVDPVTPGYTAPVVSGYDPGYVDPTVPDTTTSTYVPYNYDNYSYYNTTSYYMDYNSQYTQYLENTYAAQYDDNYYYVPSYTAPQESLIEVSSAPVDTDELTQDDWHKIMLDLSDGDAKSNDGTKTFNFIKQNTEKGDTSVDWMLYLGIALIGMAFLTVTFVVITTNKAYEQELRIVS